MAMIAIVHHREYLREHLHSKSILRILQMWSEVMPFKEKVLSKHLWDSTSKTPEINGVLPDIVLLAKIMGI